MIINHLNSHINITTSLNGFHTEASNRYLANFQLADYQCALSMKNPLTFTGKELDSETGYSYFGARYYDAELSGLFFSVDPMADKYPNISPFAYCGWSPMMLVDPNGNETTETDIVNKKNGTCMHIEDGKNQIVLLSEQAYNTIVNMGQDSYSSMSDSQKKKI